MATLPARGPFSCTAPLWTNLSQKLKYRSVVAIGPPASSAEAVLVDWALTTPRLDLLERAFFEATEPWEQERFSTAVLVLEWF